MQSPSRLESVSALSSRNGNGNPLAEAEAMKVSELRAVLQTAGYGTDGKKADLVQRYVEYRAAARSLASSSPQQKRKRPLEEPDAGLVTEVRAYMKSNKLSQVMVGQEARVSQAVISQWLSLKYHGHNAKVDTAMREWLAARRSGRVCKPAADEPTSVLRPSRSTTFGEKRVKEKRRKGLLAAQAASANGMPPPGLCQLMQLQEAAEAAAADSNDMSDGDDVEDDDPACASGKQAPGSTPQSMALQPADADPFGLAELVAKTMCELESSPAKPRGFVRPGRDSDEDAAELAASSSSSSRLSRMNAAVPGEERLTWDWVYSYSIGLGDDADCTAPPGATISVRYVQEAFYTVCGFWPTSAYHENDDKRLALADFRVFCKAADKSENKSSKLPDGYTLSRPEERAQAHQRTVTAAQAASAGPSSGTTAVAVAGGEGDEEGRRQSPPISPAPHSPPTSSSAVAHSGERAAATVKTEAAAAAPGEPQISPEAVNPATADDEVEFVSFGDIELLSEAP